MVVFADGAREKSGAVGDRRGRLDPSTTPPTRLAAVSERIGTTTNNVAEYKALIAGLQAAQRFSPSVVHVRADSKLVIEQLAGRWKVKQPHLKPLHAQARALLDGFERVDLAHVPREENTEADALVNAALDLPD